jgi:hypothetical protein
MQRSDLAPAAVYLLDFARLICLPMLFFGRFRESLIFCAVLPEPARTTTRFLSYDHFFCCDDLS